MNRRLVGVLALGLLVGCGPDVQPESARPVDVGGGVVDLPPVVGPRPEKSEPAAALLVNAVLMAHTNSQPALVDRLRKVRITRRGLFQTPGGSPTNASMEIYIWGDQYRATYGLELQGNVPQTFSLTGTTGWHVLGKDKAQPTPLSAADQENVLPDVRGDRLLMLFPLADPRLTAATAREGKGGDPVLRVWVGDQPPALLTVDAATNRLKRITYEGKELGQVVMRSLEPADLRPVAGVLLPKKVTFSVGVVPITTWASNEFEVPGLFELGVFDKP